jgi:NAD(P)-dependent dehydrogenase (short-subunit alcohol dehydrogenase family)
MRDMHGKHVLVTGATSGIGEVTARELARRGARVTIVGRNEEKIATTLATIRAAVPDAELESLRGDLSLVASTREVAARFLERHDSLDVLVNNAGALYLDRDVTSEGRERTFATNHLGYFVLTNALLPALRAAAARHGEARVVSVASAAHRAGRIDWEDLDSTRGYNGWTVYGTSKLMNILFAAELARREEAAGSKVTSNSLHPGVIASGFARNEGGFTAWLAGTFGPWFLTSSDKGARTSLHLAGSPDVRGKSGLYWTGTSPATPRAAARDLDAARRLWEISAALTG